MRNTLVSDLMTREAVIIKPSATLLEAAKKMVKSKVNSLIITEKGKLAGFVTQKDILWALVKKSRSDLSKIKVTDISPKKIHTLRPDATIHEAIQRMKVKKVDKMPVVNNSEVVGLLAARDILSFNPEIYTEFNEIKQIREQQAKLKRYLEAKKGKVREGMCERCGKNDVLHSFNGTFICEECQEKV